MQKRKFIGFMTVLAGVPGLAGIFFVFKGYLDFSPIMLLALAAILLRALKAHGSPSSIPQVEAKS